MRNSFGAFSGCIPFKSFIGFLAQCKKTNAEITELLCRELRIWKNNREYDGIVFARKTEKILSKDTDSLRPCLQTCPMCCTEDFIKVGAIWRMRREQYEKKMFWAFHYNGLGNDNEDFYPVRRVFLGSGVLQMNTRCASRCLECHEVTEKRYWEDCRRKLGMHGKQYLWLIGVRDHQHRQASSVKVNFLLHLRILCHRRHPKTSHRKCISVQSTWADVFGV